MFWFRELPVGYIFMAYYSLLLKLSMKLINRIPLPSLKLHTPIIRITKITLSIVFKLRFRLLKKIGTG